MIGGRWFRCDVLAWDVLIESMREQGPLPYKVACMDLRRHAHSPGSERWYGRRWGWHHSRVRRLIKGGEWVDPYAQQQRSSTAATPQQERSRSAAPAKQDRSTAAWLNLGNAPVSEAAPQQERSTGEAPAQQERSSSAAVEKHRNTISEYLISNKEQCSNSTEPSDWDQALALWQEHKPTGPRMTKGKGSGRLLAARLKDHGLEAVKCVLLWALVSEHERAQWLRDNGYCRIATLCNATKFESYLEHARTKTAERGEWVDHEDGPTNIPF